MDRAANSTIPSCKAWAWNDAANELINIAPSGAPASRSASSAASRQDQARMTVRAQRKRRERLEATVEEVLGTGGRVSWAEQGEEPVELQDCLRASLMLLLTDRAPLTTTFIRTLKHHRIQELLYSLLEYFSCLFDLCFELGQVTPPTVVNMTAMQQQWHQQLAGAMTSLVPAYTRLLISPENGSNAKRGDSKSQDDVRLSNSQFELLYMVAETVVWLVFRRTDRQLIRKEMTRLFKGPLGLHYDLKKDADNPKKLLEDGLEKKPGFSASTDGTTRRGPEQAKGDHRNNSREKGQATGFEKKKSQCAKKLTTAELSRQPSGLISRQPPPIALVGEASPPSDPPPPPLRYLSQSHVRGHCIGILGSAKADLTRDLEPVNTHDSDCLADA